MQIHLRNPQNFIWILLFWGLTFWFLPDIGNLAANDTLYLVENGEPKAQIVIAEDPPRMVRLAASELQDYLRKITGAELPIVTVPDENWPVHIYVGPSEYIDALGFDDGDLDFGAFQMVSGPDYLVLFGRDFDFEPPEPWASSPSERRRVEEEWDEITGGTFGNPMGGLFRRFNEASETWVFDEGGSLNAVYEFLRRLGVRWYMPGDLGEVVPETASVPLPELDETVHPDYRVRHWMLGNYIHKSWDELIWERRIGINSLHEALGPGMLAHGMRNVTGREEFQAAYPEYFALIGGERETGFRGTGHVCFSSEGLVDETVKYARAVFDHYDLPTLQLSPQDGIRPCQCVDCRDVPISELVFGFFDQVARALYESHPDRLIIGAGYSSYREPPANIEKFSPNVVISINNVGRARFHSDPEHWAWYQDLVDQWQAKLAPGHLLRVENNFSRAKPFPRIHPRGMAMDLQAMKGISIGERNEIPRSRAGEDWPDAASTHLSLYVNARYLWDANQDIDVLLDEYYDLFYGPAAEQMRAALEFAEANNDRRAGNHGGLNDEAGSEFLELLMEARRAAGDSVYGERISMILHEMVSLDPTEPIPGQAEILERTVEHVEHLRERARLLALREQAPTFSIWYFDNAKWDDAWAQFELDGNLEEEFWRPRAGLSPLADSDDRAPRTRFQIGFTQNALYVGLWCENGDKEIVIGTTENDDPAIFDGEHVEILLESDTHSFYQIVVNPAGAVFSRDLSMEGHPNWDAQAEAAAQIGDESWTAEVKIPLARNSGDPVHQVNYQQRPGAGSPWAFNIIRARVVEGETRRSAFSEADDLDVSHPAAFGTLHR